MYYFRSPLESDENEIWDVLSSASASSLEDIKVTMERRLIIRIFSTLITSGGGIPVSLLKNIPM